MSQQQRLIKQLEEKGFVNSFVATFEMKIKQAPTRIKELKLQGYVIKSKPQSNGSVNWVLEAEPKPIVKKEQKYIFVGNKATPIEEAQLTITGLSG
jgi:hypothetical protein